MTTEKFTRCPECSDPGPHITWDDPDGHLIADCRNCGHLFQPTDL